MEELDISKQLVYKKSEEDGPDIRGGFIDALIVHATKCNKKGDYRYILLKYYLNFILKTFTYFNLFFTFILTFFILSYLHFFILKVKKMVSIFLSSTISKHIFIHNILLIYFVSLLDYSYQEAFLTTYRTFISPYELVVKLIRRHQYFICQPEKKPRAREAFSLLVSVVNDLT